MMKYTLPYVLQEMDNVNSQNGRTEMRPRPKMNQMLDTKQLALQASNHQCRGVSQVEIESIIDGVFREIKEQLAQGNSVKINDVGIFMPALSDVLRQEHQDESGEQAQLPNANTIHVTGINFRVDKRFIADVDSMAEPKRVGITRQKHSSLTKEERLARLKSYLREFHYINQSKYAEIVELSPSSASKELAAMCQDPETGITSEGKHSHKVYVLRR